MQELDEMLQPKERFIHHTEQDEAHFLYRSALLSDSEDRTPSCVENVAALSWIVP